MTVNRVRDLRESRGWSQEELGRRVGTNKFKISRIESGETKLDLALTARIAEEFGVSIADVIGLVGTATGMAEDAAPYVPGASDPLARLVDPTRGRSLYVVKSEALDELKIFPGDVLQIDMSQGAVQKITPLAVVVVQLYDEKELLSARTFLRQFVPPNLLITNSRKANVAPFNMTTQDAHIKGVVISRHHMLGGIS